MKIDLRLGDCIEVLKTIPDNSIDSIVTDAPYGLSFMNKHWDYDVPSVEIWKECLRVLKPGGHLLSFAGSRTYHRMAVRIEDAGFEIRDQIMWVYGSGFPKSHNISKAIDAKIKIGKSNPKSINESERTKTDGKVVNVIQPNNGILGEKRLVTKKIGASLETEFAQQWEGWGTALKPAHEPIVLARKPLSEKSIVENVLKHGTGGINIDGSRIEMKDKENINFERPRVRESVNPDWILKQAHDYTDPQYKEYNEAGRFPANIIFDEEAGKLLDEQSGPTSQGHWSKTKTTGYGEFGAGKSEYNGVGTKDKNKDKGGASRFFYCPKTSKKDRNEGLDNFPDIDWRKEAPANPNRNERPFLPIKNNHPTVKPTDLMRYLINLVTPKGGTTLDPFMGSGSTGKAAVRCGVNFIGIEKEEEYMKIAEARINHEKNKTKQLNLLNGEV